jgi:hypothetical protein
LNTATPASSDTQINFAHVILSAAWNGKALRRMMERLPPGSRGAVARVWTEGRPAETGSEGRDDLLGPGRPKGHLDRVEGDPGTGKTTLALEFLLEGIQRGERVLV